MRKSKSPVDPALITIQVCTLAHAAIGIVLLPPFQVLPYHGQSSHRLRKAFNSWWRSVLGSPSAALQWHFLLCHAPFEFDWHFPSSSAEDTGPRSRNRNPSGGFSSVLIILRISCFCIPFLRLPLQGCQFSVLEIDLTRACQKQSIIGKEHWRGYDAGDVKETQRTPFTIG